MGKSYPQQPLVGVGVVIKHPHDGRILMVKRDSEPYRGYWSIPGGGLKLGETLEECAHREVQEECGLKISIEGLATVFDSIEFDQQNKVRYHYVLVDFVATCLGKSEPLPASDVAAACWLDIAELSSLTMTPKTREILQQLRQAGKI